MRKDHLLFVAVVFAALSQFSEFNLLVAIATLFCAVTYEEECECN